MRNIIIALITLLLIISIRSSEITCHYTCTTCSSSSYTACNTCPNRNSFSFKMANSNPEQGVCGSITTSNFNGVGIVLLPVVIFSSLLIFNEEIFYISLFLQSLSLASLIQIYWPPILDYILSGLTYLMIFGKISFQPKKDLTSNDSFLCKGIVYFRQFEFSFNFAAIGLANLIVFSLIIIITVFKNVRKKCSSERVRCFPDWILDKIVLGLSIGFLFLIQESVTTIYFSLKYGSNSSQAIAFTVLYFIGVVLYTINQFFYPFTFFRNKFIQINTIIGKIIVPMYLLGPPQSNYIFFILLIIVCFADLIAANKNKRQGSFNRLLFYKLACLACILLLMLYYFLESIIASQTISRGLGIVCIFIMLLVLHLLVTEIFFYIKTSCEDTNKIIKVQEQKKRELGQQIQITLEHVHTEESPTKVERKMENYDFSREIYKKETTVTPFPYETKQIQESVGCSPQKLSDQVRRDQSVLSQHSGPVFRDAQIIKVQASSKKEEKSSQQQQNQHNLSQKRVTQENNNKDKKSSQLKEEQHLPQVSSSHTLKPQEQKKRHKRKKKQATVEQL